MPPKVASASKAITRSKTDGVAGGSTDEDDDGGLLTLASIASLLEENRQAISADFNAAMTRLEKRLDLIQHTVSDHTVKIGALESSANLQDERLLALETTCAKPADSNAKLTAKVIDLESRSRRNNIRVFGLPESTEVTSPPSPSTVFFSKMLAEVFSGVLDSPPECDRAHRSLAAKPQPGKKPRPVIIRLHNFQVKERIILAARAKRGTLKYKGNSIFVYEDYAPEVLEQRQQYKEVMSELYKLDLKPALLFPARLTIKLKGGGRKTFDSVKDAEEYLAKLIPDRRLEGRVSDH